MRRKATYLFYVVCLLLLFTPNRTQADDKDVLGLIISLSRQNGTVYRMLEEVTERSGFLFVYDSRIIDNNKPVRLEKKVLSVREAIYHITGNDKLQMQVIGNHILLSLPATALPASIPQTAEIRNDSSYYFNVEGNIRDNYSQEPVPYATVSIKGGDVGTVTNQSGEFRLRLPDSLQQTTLQISHLGYEPKEIHCSAFKGKDHPIALEPKVVPIQEVIIRLVNPIKQIQEMLDSRCANYASKPVFLTTFYREGVEYKKKLANLTEAVFKVYKAPYESYSGNDQVKLLKMRRISNRNENDSLVARMKSGIQACLMLDVVKITPNFLTPETQNLYSYTHTDITVIDDRMANVISFEQKEQTDEPLYKGEIYIDAENNALLRANFEFNPKYIRKAGSLFITKKSKGLGIVPGKIAYTVSYKPWNGTYYISHIRGDLSFKIKKRRMFFNTSQLHTWFEMATCKTDTLDVKRFTKGEILPTRTIFSETNFKYDESFWENFNVILPEEKLQEAISKISLRIEETDH